MRKFTEILLLLLILGINSYSQQDPLVTQYYFLKQMYNPAYAGFDGEVCANLLSHQQWKKFDGAPVTSVISLDAPIPLFNQSFGVGINLIDDRYGFVRDFRGSISISYIADLGAGRIAFGISPGIYSEKFNSQWKFPDQTESILPDNSRASVFDVNAGVFYELNNLYAGFSAFHLLRPNLIFSSASSDNSGSIALVNHFYFTTGYTLNLEKYGVELTPSLLAKSDGNNLQFDINILALYNKKFWVGVTYRNKSAMSFQTGTYIKNIKVGLAYDLPLNSINRVSYGTLEVYLGYSFSFIGKTNIEKYRNVKTL